MVPTRLWRLPYLHSPNNGAIYVLQEARDLDRQLEHARSAAAVAERRR